MKKIFAVSALALVLVGCSKAEVESTPNAATAAPVAQAQTSVAAVTQPEVSEPSQPAGEISAEVKEDVSAAAETLESAGEIKKPEAIYKPGVHYRVLDMPVPTIDPNRIEVVEIFSYHCGHCFNFEPLLHSWKEKLPKDVSFVQTHAIWNPGMENLARGYYTGVALRIADKAHLAAFNYLHVDRKVLNTADQWASFYTQFGITKDVALKTFNSLGVTNMVSQAKARVSNYKITGTPELVIEGKYGVSAGMANGQAEMLQVTNYLIELSRYERAQKKAQQAQ